jgi:hypothetical protein
VAKIIKIVIVCSLLFGAGGCQNVSPIHLHLEGLPPSLEFGKIESLVVGDGGLRIKGQSAIGVFSIDVRPWPDEISSPPKDDYSLYMNTIFLPDGPSSVIKISNQQGLLLEIGYHVRGNAPLLSQYRLRRGKTRGHAVEATRLWTSVIVETVDGTSISVEPGGSIELKDNGIVWLLYIPGASVLIEKNTERPGKIAVEEPEFIADYILLRKQ